MDHVDEVVGEVGRMLARGSRSVTHTFVTDEDLEAAKTAFAAAGMKVAVRDDAGVSGGEMIIETGYGSRT